MTVDHETGEFLYTIYNLLFNANIDFYIKQRTFETAANSKNSWRVVSISKNAIQHIIKHKNAKGLQRGHLLQRSLRSDYLFKREHPLNKDELLSYFFEHDTVALITKEENDKSGTSHWSDLVPVPEDLFTAGSFSIYLRKSKEIPWIETLIF